MRRPASAHSSCIAPVDMLVIVGSAEPKSVARLDVAFGRPRLCAAWHSYLAAVPSAHIPADQSHARKLISGDMVWPRVPRPRLCAAKHSAQSISLHSEHSWVAGVPSVHRPALQLQVQDPCTACVPVWAFLCCSTERSPSLWLRTLPRAVTPSGSEVGRVHDFAPVLRFT